MFSPNKNILLLQTLLLLLESFKLLFLLPYNLLLYTRVCRANVARVRIYHNEDSLIMSCQNRRWSKPGEQLWALCIDVNQFLFLVSQCQNSGFVCLVIVMSQKAARCKFGSECTYLTLQVRGFCPRSKSSNSDWCAGILWECFSLRKS